ncbi:MAG: prepilin peptidase [Planctomycetota bacterium]
MDADCDRRTLQQGVCVCFMAVAATDTTEGSQLFFPRRQLAMTIKPRFSYRMIGIAFLILIATVWLIVIPIAQAYLQRFEERPSGIVEEQLSTGEILQIRAAKLAVFTVFTYLGACVGSFLNVVAASAPRGRSVLTRSSSCPECGKPIRRSDNLPIIGFISLGGKCRACGVPIASRYLVVECIAAGIFAYLFLIQLVSGAANVPGFWLYAHTGIIWMIFYTKWKVVGIYFFHAIMFSWLLVFALIENDDLKVPRTMSFPIILVFASLAVLLPILQPVPYDGMPPINLTGEAASWISRLITCGVGAVTGGIVALIVTKRNFGAPLAAALILLGVTLGWQATLTIAAAWLFFTLLLNRLLPKIRPTWLGPTALLLAVSLCHHPAWRFLTDLW